MLVPPPQQYQEPLRRTVDELVGRPVKWGGGVWVGDLHDPCCAHPPHR
ncbi:hypothetical protein AB0C59_08800 [Streptomyces sp. NPDC048664]